MATPPKIVIAGGNNSAYSSDGGATWVYGTMPTVSAAPADGPFWHTAISADRIVASPWWARAAEVDFLVTEDLVTSTDGVAWAPVLDAAYDSAYWNDGQPAPAPAWSSALSKFVGSRYTTFARGWTYASGGKAVLGGTLGAYNHQFKTHIIGTRIVSFEIGEYAPVGSTQTYYSDDGGATWAAGVVIPSMIYGTGSDDTYIWCVSPDGKVYRTNGLTYDMVATGVTADMAMAVSATSVIWLRDNTAWRIGKSASETPTSVSLPVTPTRAWVPRRPDLPEEAFTVLFPDFTVKDDWRHGSWFSGAVVGNEVWFVGNHAAGDTTNPLVVKTADDGATFTQVTGITPSNGTTRYWTSISVYEPPVAEGGMVDTLNIASPFIAPADQVFASIGDALNIAHGIAGSVGLSAAITDMLILFSDGSAAFPVDAAMVDGLYMADGGAIGTYDPYDLINNPAQYAFNIRDKAVSIYSGFDFTSYASVGQDLYAANSTGVYLVRGSTDNGTPINAGLDLGATTLGTTKAKSIEAVYLGLDTDGCAYVRTYVNGVERAYRVVRNGQIMRALLAKGVTGRTWGVKVDITEASHASLDVVELFTGINTRRWTR